MLPDEAGQTLCRKSCPPHVRESVRWRVRGGIVEPKRSSPRSSAARDVRFPGRSPILGSGPRLEGEGGAGDRVAERVAGCGEKSEHDQAGANDEHVAAELALLE